MYSLRPDARTGALMPLSASDVAPNPAFVLKHPTLKRIAESKGWSVPRVALAWALQQTPPVIIPLVRTVNETAFECTYNSHANLKR